MVLLKAEMVSTSNVDKQYEIVASYIDNYNPKQVVVDAGGGTYQVQKLESRYASLVRRNSYLTRPEAPLPTKQEEKKLRKENRYTIDRTYSIDRIINRINNRKLVIPANLGLEVTFSSIVTFSVIAIIGPPMVWKPTDNKAN